MQTFSCEMGTGSLSKSYGIPNFAQNLSFSTGHPISSKDLLTKGSSNFSYYVKYLSCVGKLVVVIGLDVNKVRFSIHLSSSFFYKTHAWLSLTYQTKQIFMKEETCAQVRVRHDTPKHT